MGKCRRADGGFPDIERQDGLVFKGVIQEGEKKGEENNIISEPNFAFGLGFFLLCFFFFSFLFLLFLFAGVLILRYYIT